MIQIPEFKFFESGYNDKPWIWPQGPRTDYFYTEYDIAPSTSSLAEHLRSWLRRWATDHGAAIVIDDGSAEALILRAILEDLSFVKFVSLDSIRLREPSDRWNTCGVLGAEELLALSIAENFSDPVILPRARSRVINMHWSHVHCRPTQEFPYWLLWDSERHHLLLMNLRRLKIPVLTNLLMASPEIFAAFLTHRLSVDLLNLEDGPDRTGDNYGVEREILAELYGILSQGTLSQDLWHKRPWNLPKNFVVSSERPPLIATAPMHRFLREKLGVQIRGADLIQEWYGN